MQKRRPRGKRAAHARLLRTLRLLGTLACLAALAAAPPAEAQAPEGEVGPTHDEKRAREIFERGRIHYENGDFLEASAAFEEAYALSGKADLLYNLYVAYRDANRQKQAAEALRRYLDEGEAIPNRPQLEARLAALEAGIAKREAERAAAARRERDEAGDEATAADAAPVEPVAGLEDDRWWLYPTVMLAAGGGLMVASVPTGVVARGKADDLDAQCPDGSCAPGLESTRDSGRATAIATDVLLFSGAAVAVAGAIWMVVKRPGEDGGDRARRVRPHVACGPGSCGGSLTVSF